MTSLHASGGQETEACPQLHPMVCSARKKQIWREEMVVTMETRASASSDSPGMVQELRAGRGQAWWTCHRRAG